MNLQTVLKGRIVQSRRIDSQSVKDEFRSDLGLNESLISIGMAQQIKAAAICRQQDGHATAGIGNLHLSAVIVRDAADAILDRWSARR